MVTMTYEILTVMFDNVYLQQMSHSSVLLLGNKLSFNCM
jgi:hypothetical protein